jgi:hypothetical protein
MPFQNIRSALVPVRTLLTAFFWSTTFAGTVTVDLPLAK